MSDRLDDEDPQSLLDALQRALAERHAADVRVRAIEHALNRILQRNHDL